MTLPARFRYVRELRESLLVTRAVAMGLTPLPERPQWARLRCLVPRGRWPTT